MFLHIRLKGIIFNFETLIKSILTTFLANKSVRAKVFESINYVVDKLHIKVGKNCLRFCHPKNFEMLEKINTVVCKQKNFWLGKYKYIMRYMGMYRFNFFYLFCATVFNRLNIDGELDYIQNNYLKEKTRNFKRKQDNDSEPISLDNQSDFEDSGIDTINKYSGPSKIRNKIHLRIKLFNYRLLFNSIINY